MHGVWGIEDDLVLSKLQPDLVLFVGDLSEGDVRIAKAIRDLPFPTAVILGNHDRGRDSTGYLLECQLRILGENHCGWKSLEWEGLPIAVVGARPCSAGGGFHLPKAVENVFGPITIDESVDRIIDAAKSVRKDIPIIILAHSGPMGLGSDPSSICGRDWKKPSVDWGDQDLTLALEKIRQFNRPPLVVFGHMHHQLKRNSGKRETFLKDKYGTIYLNTACVPRRTIDSNGQIITHFSCVEFSDGIINYVAHEWLYINGQVSYKNILLDLR